MTEQTTKVNDQLVLVCGESSTGKSMCLKNLENVLYLNCESGKRLPFKPKQFIQKTITVPEQIFEAFEWVDDKDEVEHVVIDGLNYLMDMYYSHYIYQSKDAYGGWAGYQQYFKKILQYYVPECSKSVIFTGHTRTDYNEKTMLMETKVPIQGSLSNQGVESYFSCIVATKKMPISKLKEYQNDLLKITPKEELLGFKYVFQTQITKDTIHERMRSPLELFADNETFIDNDVSLVLQRLNEYYAE